MWWRRFSSALRLWPSGIGLVQQLSFQNLQPVKPVNGQQCSPWRRAKTVTILAGRGEEEPSVGSAEVLLQPLRIQAAIRPFSANYAPVGATLLKLARDEGADLLVMGAYSHSPATEVVLGGVTRHILAHADLPVPIVH
jgi:Universal stress protein family